MKCIVNPWLAIVVYFQVSRSSSEFTIFPFRLRPTPTTYQGMVIGQGLARRVSPSLVAGIGALISPVLYIEIATFRRHVLRQFLLSFGRPRLGSCVRERVQEDP